MIQTAFKKVKQGEANGVTAEDGDGSSAAKATPKSGKGKRKGAAAEAADGESPTKKAKGGRKKKDASPTKKAITEGM
jgi:hypothetical protein